MFRDQSADVFCVPRLWLADRASTENHAAVTDFETVATDLETAAVKARDRRVSKWILRYVAFGFETVATDFQTAAVKARARRSPNDNFFTLHLIWFDFGNAGMLLVAALWKSALR